MVAFANPRHRRRRSHRRSRRNPGTLSLRRPLGAMSAGFQPSAIVKSATIAGGAILNYWVREKAAALIPFDAVKSGLGNHALGLGTAGLLALVPKVGPQLFTGAVLGEVLRLIQTYVFPNIRILGEYLEMSGLGNTGEYLEMNGAAALDQGDLDNLDVSEIEGL